MMDETEEPIAITEEMKEGLAFAYAQKGFRLFLEHTIKKANQSLIKYLDQDDMVNAQRLANRIKAWKQLLIKGQEQFINFEKLKK